MDRTDRAPEQEEEAPQFAEQTITTMDVDITRQPLPEPSDGEVWPRDGWVTHVGS